jgi:hypothetical protein
VIAVCDRRDYLGLNRGGLAVFDVGLPLPHGAPVSVEREHSRALEAGVLLRSGKREAKLLFECLEK